MRYTRETNWHRVEALQTYADHRGVPLLHVAIGGLAAQPAVGSVIAGVSRPDQVAVNAEAAAWEPAPEDLAALDDAVPPGSGSGENRRLKDARSRGSQR
ncbi:MAG: aldo/keto reductase [Mobilicoccus sp.]|nr:aldo/keto reductase [Mobilicoccus sp.]